MTTTSNHPTANHLFAYTVEEYDAGSGKRAKNWVNAAMGRRD